MIYSNTQIRASEPPEFLFKAVAGRTADKAFREGLKRGGNAFITVYQSETEARTEIREKIVICFVVMARLMAEDGFQFYHNGSKWLTETIPPKYLRFQ